ncbi:ATP-grasp domain-containing protein [Luteimonas sp. A501]
MIEVAILTPDPAVGEYEQLWPVVLARLQATLHDEGIHATPTPWTAHVGDAARLRDFAQVLPLLAWSYHLDHARWLEACVTWRLAGVPMANPADVLAWNSDKRYLVDLSARGIAIPHTVWMQEPSRVQLEQTFDDTGASELIVKPSVSGGAWKTQRVGRDGIDEAVAAAAGGGDMLVQPYLPTIASEGETSLLYFGGKLSHVVNKRPVPGDFRVQETFGGQYTLLPEPPAGALELAGKTLAAIDAPLLYARIDVVPGADGRWLLMEAELIEPDFYLGVDPRRGAAFAQALRARI